MALPTFRNWKNNDIFSARSYVYERDTIVNEINRLAGIQSAPGIYYPETLPESEDDYFEGMTLFDTDN